MDTAWFIAVKYLRPSRNAVSVITLISVIGVTLGVAVLVIVLAVMTGFTDLMKTKLLETQAHFHVRGYGGIGDPDDALARIREAGAEGAPVVQSPALVQLDQTLDAQVLVFGVDEQDVRRHMKVGAALRRGSLKLGRGEAIISSDMARRWGVTLGSRILVHSPGRLTGLVRFRPEGGVELNPDSPVYLPAEFLITGIYSFGKYDFDRSVIFVGRDDAAELFGLPWGGASIIYGWVRDPFDMEGDLKRLRGALKGLTVTSWQEENRQLLGVLAVEKRMMFFLLVFIVLVAAFSIANTLITSVYQKTREIGIIKAIGAGDATVMRIFVFQGLLVGLTGALLGTGLGALVLWLRNDILRAASRLSGQELFPKEFYFFNELPSHMVPGDVLIVAGCAVLLCAVGAVVPALRAARLDPAKALRYE